MLCTQLIKGKFTIFAEFHSTSNQMTKTGTEHTSQKGLNPKVYLLISGTHFPHAQQKQVVDILLVAQVKDVSRLG